MRKFVLAAVAIAILVSGFAMGSVLRPSSASAQAQMNAPLVEIGSSGGTTNPTAVTFPRAFAKAPAVQVALSNVFVNSSNSPGCEVHIVAGSVSSTGFTAQQSNGGGGCAGLQWMWVAVEQ